MILFFFNCDESAQLHFKQILRAWYMSLAQILGALHQLQRLSALVMNVPSPCHALWFKGGKAWQTKIWSIFASSFLSFVSLLNIYIDFFLKKLTDCRAYTNWYIKHFHLNQSIGWLVALKKHCRAEEAELQKGVLGSCVSPAN